MASMAPQLWRKAKKKQQMIDYLKSTHDNVKDWLKFAEAKNAALVAACGGGIWAGVKALADFEGGFLSVYLAFALSLLVISLVIGILSFVPQTDYSWIVRRSQPAGSDNLLFFGHLSKYSKADLRKRLLKIFGNNRDECSPAEDYYIEQIIINSRIALYKYKCFTAAAWLLLAAVATPATALACAYFMRGRDSGF